ncbi:MAG: hypothetical protein APF84_15365 [Gracilibacter sp. BRH_c7a]|nr:MAG: hypothetical protein APF84_15365 [Gracilibacter sp. BRH_c7a]
MGIRFSKNMAWGIIFLLFSGFVLSESLSLPYRPDAEIAIRGGFFPTILSSLLIILNIILIFQKNKDSDKEKTVSRKAIIRVSSIVGGIIAYIILLPVLGFIVSAFLFVVLCVRTLGEQSWKKASLFAFLMVIAVYVVFHIFLNVRFPVGILGF